MWVAAVCNTAEGLFKVFLTHRSQLNLKSASIKKNFARTVLLYLLIFGYNKKKLCFVWQCSELPMWVFCPPIQPIKM